MVEDSNRELNFKEDIEITLKNKDEVIEKNIQDELGTINTIDINKEEDKKMLNVTNKTKLEKNEGPSKKWSTSLKEEVKYLGHN